MFSLAVMQHCRCIVGRMEHSEGLPHILIDRCLGNIFASLLRQQGLHVTTLAEHYGEEASQKILDPEWLALAGARGWIVFTKDRSILRNPVDKQALTENKVKCFCLHPSKGLASHQLSERILQNLDMIAKVCAEPGPLFYVLNAEGLKRIDVGYTGQSDMLAEHMEGAGTSDMVKSRGFEKGEKSGDQSF